MGFRLIPRIPWYRILARPFLFRLAPETAQQLTERTLSARRVWKIFRAEPPSVPTNLASIQLRNPVGLAAGLDKRCAYLDTLGGFGFGYVVGGTVTRYPRPGNPKPRVLRLPKQQSLINALGFPSEGLDVVADRLRALKNRPARVIVSLAALEEIDTIECLRVLEPLVDAVELNISSPNTEGLRRYQEPDALSRLLEVLNGERNKPLFVKLPPYSDKAGKRNVLALVHACSVAGVNGVTAINTVPIEDRRLAIGRGGVSGQLIKEDMLRILSDIRREVDPSFLINACGGIGSTRDALEALDAGANTVQLYSSMVFRGPGLINEIVRGIARASNT